MTRPRNKRGAVRYKCPSCGFQIFNRRIAKCESCGAALPEELLLSAEQVAELDAAHEKSMKEKAARGRTAREDDSGAFLDFVADGGGDGGD
jgi:hypothetical protein